MFAEMIDLDGVDMNNGMSYAQCAGKLGVWVVICMFTSQTFILLSTIARPLLSV